MQKIPLKTLGIALATGSCFTALSCAHTAAPTASGRPTAVQAPPPAVAPAEVAAHALPEGESAARPPSVEDELRRQRLSRAFEQVAAEIPDEPEDDGEGDDPTCGEGESPETRPGVRYTAELEDEHLAQLWQEDAKVLGSISVGFPDSGRIFNARQLEPHPHWTIVTPLTAWGTEETLAYLAAAIGKVAERFPDGAPLRVNHISAPNGGWLRPHQSHQAGRDVDLAFYYGADGPDRGPWAVRNNLDLARNWTLVRALITETDVEVILVDRSIIAQLYDHALAQGEDKAWLDSVFRTGRKSLVRHANKHKDHFHVRFYNPRAQELGRRILPLMPKDPRANLRFHRVQPGDTLGKLAYSFGSTVRAIQQANRLRGTVIRAGQKLVIPLRGPCTNCPMPPEVIVPPRRLPPSAPPLFASMSRPEIAAELSEHPLSAIGSIWTASLDWRASTRERLAMLPVPWRSVEVQKAPPR